MRALLAAAVVLLGTSAFAADRYVGGGASDGAAAPLLFLGAFSPKVSVTQLLYSRDELMVPAGSRIIDVAWRKADLTALPMAGCDLELWMKNVPLGDAFSSGSTQTFGDATNQAMRVYSATQAGLPSTMGFVSLTPALNMLAFDYTGNDLEVTVVADCHAVSTDVSSTVVPFRYDTVADRIRVFFGDAAPLPGSVLTADPAFVARRPHTLFRFLVPPKTLALRVGNFQLTPGATYATAAKHLAAGKVAPFRFTAVNDGVGALTVNSVLFSNTVNGTPMVVSSPLGTFMPGEEKALTVELNPTIAALTRFTMTVQSDAVAGDQAVTFQGTATATPEAQPNLAQVKDDHSTMDVATGAHLQLGNVAPGDQHLVTLRASNFGAADQVPVTMAVTAQPAGGMTRLPTGITPLDAQVDQDLVLNVVTPTTAGAFSTTVRVTIGTQVWDVTLDGVVTTPELDIDGPGGPIADYGTDALGDTVAGQVLVRTYTLKNTGNRDLHVSRAYSFAVQQANADSVALQTPTVIAPGGQQTMGLTFTAQGPAVAINLNVNSDDADENPYTIKVLSMHSGGPKLAVTAEDMRSSSDPVDRHADVAVSGDQLVFNLQNIGDATLTLSAVTLTAITNTSPAFENEPALPNTLAPNASLTLVVLAGTLTTSTAGTAFKLGVNVASDDPDGPFPFTASGLAKPHYSSVSSCCGRSDTTYGQPFVVAQLVIGYALARRWRRRR